jgi:hypothetical protein
VIVLAGGISGLRGLWAAIREWVRGRAEVARERENRATAEIVLRDLDQGVWMDRDGERIRLIIKPVTGSIGFDGHTAQAGRLPQVEQSNGRTPTQ